MVVLRFVRGFLVSIAASIAGLGRVYVGSAFMIIVLRAVYVRSGFMIIALHSVYVGPNFFGIAQTPLDQNVIDASALRTASLAS